MKSTLHRRVQTRTLTNMVVLGALACGVSAQAQKAQIEITYWGNNAPAIVRFQQLNPGIKVNSVQLPSGSDYYDKLLTSLKAGTAPDVANVEYQMLPTVLSTGKLVNLAPLGASALKNRFEPWLWNQISLGGGVYAVPIDVGPMALVYREDLFKKAGLKVPTTWSGFADAATKLKATNPNGYIASFASNDPGWFTGLAWQAGARWFKISGDTWEVNINDAATKKVAAYWQTLIDKKQVKLGPAWNDVWYGAFQSGEFATWPTAAWGPGFLSSIAPKTSGAWRVALLPSWNATSPTSSNWGGSSTVVTADSKHPKEAAKLAIFLGANLKDSVTPAVQGGMFPALSAGINAEALSRRFPFYGNQKVNGVFRQAQRRVDPNFQWGPTMTQVYRDLGDQFGLVAGGKLTLPEAMDAVQASTVAYMKKQGFSVK